jgi:hypothetical protein
MRTLYFFVFLFASLPVCCFGDESDPYGANGPCAYLFQAPGGNCLDGVFTLEIEIGPGRQIVASKVVSSSATAKSSGPVAPLAECMASHMAFYARWQVKHIDTPGKEIVTIHVVNANTCK